MCRTSEEGRICPEEESEIMTGSELIKLAVDKLSEVSKEPVRADGSTGGANVRAGAVTSKGIVRYNAHPCHAYMKHYEDAMVVFSQYMHHPEINKEADKAYFQWITGPESPWRNFRGHDYTLAGSLWDGFVWDHLELHPSNLQQSFLVASRMPKEWKDLIEKWYQYTNKYHVHPGVSFVFLDSFRSSGLPKLPGSFIINQTNKYDWPIDITTSGEDMVRNFCLGRLDHLTKSYAEYKGYKPVNRLWGNNEIPLADPKTYPNLLFSLYHDKFGYPEGDCQNLWKDKLGLSKFDYRTHWFVSEGEMISIMHEEQKRLKL